MNQENSPPWRRARVWLATVAALALLACGGGGGDADGAVAPSAGVSAGSSAQSVEVPAALAASVPQDRQLNVPQGFGIRVWARLPRARFMALAPNGDVLVSVPSEGRIVLLRPGDGALPQAFDLATGLRQPHDMVFYADGSTSWLYFTESNRVSRVAWQPGQTSMGAPEVVVDGLPDASTVDGYAHELKNIAISADGKLYVAIASGCNACAEDARATLVRGAIYQYDANGGNGRLLARGVRNAEGLAVLPATNALWAAVNNRDEVKVPLNQDVDGDGSNDLGKLLQSWVDNNPPEPLTAVQDGGNYGWPFCNLSADGKTYLRDFDTNADGGLLDCATATPSTLTLPAHSAPLGMSFLQNTNVAAPLRNGAVIALHGCWNCSSLTAGFKVVFVPFDGGGNPGAPVDLVSGFVTDAQARQVWGRPVDAIADAAGNLLISDDLAGVIYLLYPK